MKFSTLLSIIAALVSLSACRGQASMHGQLRDWNFIQSVGGLALDPPFEKAGKWFLPFRFDVTGLQTVTVKPKTLNSALACSGVKVSIKENSIFLTVMTGLIRKGVNSACPPVELEAIERGSYSVFYLNPSRDSISLGKITIGP